MSPNNSAHVGFYIKHTSMSEWRVKAAEASRLLTASRRGEEVNKKTVELLQSLNDFPYPFTDLDHRVKKAGLSLPDLMLLP